LSYTLPSVSISNLGYSLFLSVHISNLGYSLFLLVLISNLRYNFHMHRVNPYVLFRSAYISNLGHDHMPLLLFSPPGNLHLCEFNVPVESGYLLRSNLQIMHILTISTRVSHFLNILCLDHYSISFTNIDTTSDRT